MMRFGIAQQNETESYQFQFQFIIGKNDRGTGKKTDGTFYNYTIYYSRQDNRYFELKPWLNFVWNE